MSVAKEADGLLGKLIATVLLEEPMRLISALSSALVTVYFAAGDFPTSRYKYFFAKLKMVHVYASRI